MIQAQNEQQPPQGATAELYSQLEDYLALGRLDSDIGKEDSQQKTTRRVIKKKSSRQQEEESSATSSGTLSIQVNGEVIRGSASEIIGRMVEAEMGPTFQEEALKAQAVAAYTYVRYHNQRGTMTASTSTPPSAPPMQGSRWTPSTSGAAICRIWSA